MFGRKKKAQKSTNNIDKIVAQTERTRKLNNDLLVMSIDFTGQTTKRLKEVKR